MQLQLVLCYFIVLVYLAHSSMAVRINDHAASAFIADSKNDPNDSKCICIMIHDHHRSFYDVYAVLSCVVFLLVYLPSFQILFASDFESWPLPA